MQKSAAGRARAAAPVRAVPAAPPAHSTRAPSDDDDLTESDATSSDGVDDDSDDDDEDGDDGSSGSDDGAPIDVDFSFTDPKPIDFKSVRRLLEHYLPGEEASFPVSALAEDVIAQRVVGTMIKVDGDGYNDAYAFATVLPMVSLASRPWATAVRGFTTKTVARASAAAVDALAAAWAAPAKLGLLLSERVFNMPPELAPLLFESLLADLAWARTNAPPVERAAFSALTHLLVIAPCWAEPSPDAPPAAAEDTGAVPPGHVSHFLRFEEEIFARAATVRAAIPVTAVGDEAASMGGAAAAGGAGAGAPSRKRKAKQTGDEEDAASTALRTPLLRRVLLFPVAALEAAVANMKRTVETAKAELAAQTEAAESRGGGGGVGASARGAQKKRRA